jgi:hypothetical protein
LEIQQIEWEILNKKVLTGFGMKRRAAWISAVQHNQQGDPIAVQTNMGLNSKF